MRVKGGITRKRRHQKVLKSTKGYRMTKNNLYKVAHEAFLHAGQYAYNDRQKKAGEMRKLWISRINSACKINGITYKKLFDSLNKKNILLNRKVLADIALNNPETFSFIVKSI